VLRILKNSTWLCYPFFVEDEVEAMVQKCVEIYGRLDTAFNNASAGACRGNYGFSPYYASKSGIVFLSQAAAIENASCGIRINAILPGPTGRTSLMEYFFERG